MEVFSRFNALDLAIAAFLAIGFLVGWSQGLLRQLLGFAGLYIALVLGAQYHRLLARWIAALVPSALPVVVDAVAFFFIFGVAMAIFNWLGHQVYASLRLPFIGCLDGLLGAIFGLLAGCIQLIIALTVLQFLVSINWREWEPWRQTILALIRTSTLFHPLLASAPTIFALLKPWLPAGLPAIFATY